jgi:hypothetical protein
MRDCSGGRVRTAGWSLLTLLAALMLLRGRRSATALPSSQGGFLFAPAMLGGKSKDPYFSSVVLLMHCEGAHGGTSFTDSSLYGRSLIRMADAATSATQKRFGTTSMYSSLGGQGRIKAATAPELVMGNQDFTAEGWVFITNHTSWDRNIIGAATQLMPAGSWYLGLSSSNKLRWAASGGDVAVGGTTLPSNQWVHVAYSRSGGTARLFVNGAVEATFADARNYSAAIDAYVGESGNSPGSITGYTDEVRLTKGVGRYTAAFTPPSSAFPDA